MNTPFPDRSNGWRFFVAATLVAALISLGSVWPMYSAAYNQRLRSAEWAVDTIAGLLESGAVADSEIGGRPEQSEATVMARVARGLGTRLGRSNTEELVLGRLNGQRLQILRAGPDGQFEVARDLTFDGTRARPLHEALEGRRGSGSFLDHDGRPVLAAYAPLPTAALGVVYKIDVNQVRAPLLLAGAVAGGVYLASMTLVALWFTRFAGKLESRADESETAFRALFDQVAVGVVVADLRGVIALANDRICQILGCTRERLHQLGVEGVSHPDDLAKDWALMQQLVAGRIPFYQIEKRYVRPSGEIVWGQLTVSPRRRGGAIQDVIGVVVDITERKSSEEKVRQSRELIRTVADTTPDFVFVKDLEHRFVMVNRALATAQGLAPEDMIGRPDSDFWPLALCEGDPQTGTPGYHHDDRRAFNGEAVHNPRDVGTLADGTRRIFDTVKVPLRNESGEIVGVVACSRDVTDREHLEEARRQSEQLFRELGAYLPEHLSVFDAKTGALLYVNEAWVRAYGTAPELGSDIRATFAWVHADDVERFRKAARQSPAGGINEVVRIVPRDGRLRWMRIQTIGIRNAAGDVYRVAGIGEDVTEQRLAEDAAQRERDRLREILDSLYGFVGLYDLEGRLIEANRAPLAAAGLQREAVLGQLFWETYWWNYDEGIQQRLKDALARAALGEVVRYETEVRILDDRRVIIDVTFGPLRGDDGAIQSLIGFAVDVTERKRAEKALAGSEHRLQQAQKIAGIGSWELDLSTNRLWWSDEIYRLFEVEPGDFGASYDAFLDAIHPDDRERVNAAYTESLHDQTPYAITHRLLMADGRVKVVEEHWETDFSPDGTPLRSRGTVQDVTARVAVENALRESLAEKETLLREVHHRVKNNLQIISSLLHFQAKKVKDPVHLAAFTEGRDRLRSMILVHEKLYKSRGLSKIDVAGYLASLVHDLQQSYAPVIAQVRVCTMADPVSLPIESALPCGMIVCELMTNVFKYAFPDGRSGEVNLTLTAQKDRVVLTVSDNGVGLPSDLDPRESTSFGWQLIGGLVDQVNGTVTIENNAGTQVTVSFPRVAA